MKQPDVWTILYILVFVWWDNCSAFQIQSSRTGGHPTSTQITDAFQEDVPSLVILLPKEDTTSKFGRDSPVESPSIHEAAKHLAKKAFYFADGLLQIQVSCVDDPSINQDADIVLAYGLASPEDMAAAQTLFKHRSETLGKQMCQMCVDCAADLPSIVGPYDTETFSPLSLLPWSQDATGQRLYEQMDDLFQRYTTDDFCGAIVLFLNQFVTPIEWVRYSTAATWEKGALRNAKELYDMATKCGDCLGPCVQDESCRTCLTKLTEVDPRDQALSYRTIVSYESELLTKFSLCAFTKHNIFESDATIPKVPIVKPISTWRGKAVTEEVARSLLVGHLRGEETAPSQSQQLEVSWKVACGANVAYDQFPSQNQLFYPSSSKNAKLMWYDPVFRVQTLDGRNVWCKRHYRVKQQDEDPATFRLSVSDNGYVVSFFICFGPHDQLSLESRRMSSGRLLGLPTTCLGSYFTTQVPPKQ